jgi:D-alanine-D-alanine ligase
MGGLSSERAISLISGANVFNALDRGKHDLTAIDVGLRRGQAAPPPPPAQCPLPLPEMKPLEALMEPPHFDVAFIALHGRGGEDGSLQGFLELLGIPYTGSGVLASALALDKIQSKRIFLQQGIPTAEFLEFDARCEKPVAEWESRALEALGLPLVVKPAAEGSSIGVTIVRSEEQMAPAARFALTYDQRIFAERYVQGMELTAAILGNHDPRVLPLVEIVPEGGFYDYERKYTPGATQEIVPARVSESLAERARQAALAAHSALGCWGWSRVDMRSDGANVWVLEANTIPGLTPLSLVPCAAAAVGIPFPQLMETLIALALEPPVRPEEVGTQDVPEGPRPPARE